MKNFFAILLALLGICWELEASTITATLEFTNTTWGPSNFITIKANTRRFTNDPSGSTATLITTNATGNGSATNFYLHTGLNAYGGGILTRFASSNKVQVIGDETLTASIGAGFATLTLDTNGSGAKYNFQGPFSAMAGTNATNQASETIRGFAFASNSIPPTSPPMVAFAKATNGAIKTPQITGGTASNLTAVTATLIIGTNGQIMGGWISGVAISNVTWLSGIVGALTNGSWNGGIFTSSTLTNPVVVGSVFVSPDPVTGFASLLLDGVWNLAGNASGDLFIENTDNGDLPVRFSAAGGGGTVFTLPVTVSNLVTVTHSLTASNLIALFRLLSTNGVFAGTNQWPGDIAYISGTVSSLANGVNMAIQLPQTYAVDMSGGTGIVQLNGFKAGRDGETHELRLSGAITNILVHSSSVSYSPDSGATNRINICAPGDYLQVTNNGWPNWVKIRYRTAATQWEVISAR